VLWLAVVSVGMWFVVDHANAPGEVGDAVEQWPADSRLSRDPVRPTLILFVHPHCPCMRASLDELTKVLTYSRGGARVHVQFLKPKGHRGEWGQTGVWQQAAAIPGVEVAWDEGGAEARRFGALTSGHAVLYAPNGRLLYHGGLTPSRAHEGDNSGESCVIALLNGEPATHASYPVFGCPLFDE
jgi:hypothetical protein